MQNIYIKNILIGILLIAIGGLMFYVGFFRNFLLLQNGEIESFRFDIRALMSPLLFSTGFFLIVLQPTSNVFGPWKTLEAQAKRWVLISGSVGLIASAILFSWYLLNYSGAGRTYPEAFDSQGTDKVQQISTENSELLSNIEQTMIAQDYSRSTMKDVLSDLNEDLQYVPADRQTEFLENYLRTLIDYPKN
jgi:formate hydrogenlyase subunit 3/multisubunit Na+/H+ antiporter MnhD subunit